MEIFVFLAQIILAASIFNVWIFRANKQSAWRGGDARNIAEEFEIYGLSFQFMNLVKTLKIACALLLLIGIWLTPLTKIAALGLTGLMLGAVLMHIKVGDPAKKLLPAGTLLILALSIFFLS